MALFGLHDHSWACHWQQHSSAQHLIPVPKYPYSGTGLLPALVFLLSLVLDSPDAVQSGILKHFMKVEKDTPCTPIMLREGYTLQVCSADVGQRFTPLHVHTAAYSEDGYTLHVHTDDVVYGYCKERI